MGKLIKTKLLFLFALLQAMSVSALEEIPDMTGTTGYINLGLGVASVESNVLAEVAGQDPWEENISDLDSADSESLGLPVVAFELSYVFDGKTQIYVGNLIEDYLRFDLTTRAGVRHDLGGAGRLGVSVLASPITTKVWENPYQTGSDRDSVDRDSSGFRVSWDDIFGSGIEIRYTSKETDIDDELSGVGLGLTQSQIDSLDRNGDVNRATLRFPFYESETNQFFLGVNVSDSDLDGDAMSNDATSIELNWFYSAPSRKYKVVTNLLIGSREFDEDNPVFGEKADSDFAVVTVSAFFPELFGWKEWTTNVSLIAGQDDSDTDFFDDEVTMITFGLLHRF